MRVCAPCLRVSQPLRVLRALIALHGEALAVGEDDRRARQLRDPPAEDMGSLTDASAVRSVSSPLRVLNAYACLWRRAATRWSASRACVRVCECA